jgi:hypothetical protein
MCFIKVKILLSICCEQVSMLNLSLFLALRSIGIRQRRSGHHTAARRRIVDGLVAVLVARAVVGESSDLPVVAFQRVEVGIGGVSQDFARSALAGRDIGDQPGPGSGQERKRRIVDIAIVELLDVRNLPPIYFEPHGHQRAASWMSRRACNATCPVTGSAT